MRRAATISLVFLLSSLVVFMAPPPSIATSDEAKPPNLLFILTDDQRIGSMRVMPATRDAFPIAFTRALVTDPNCCPSRSVILTGQHVYNTEVFNNSLDSYLRFRARQQDSLGPWLQSLGYRTGFIGKYFNSYHPVTEPAPPGWDEFYGFHGGGAEGTNKNSYFHYVLKEHYPSPSGPVEEAVEYTDTYSTSLFSDLAAGFISRSSDPAFNHDGRPWALFVWPKAPHFPQTPEPAYEDAVVFDWKVPPSFLEEDMSDKPDEVVDSPLGERPARFYLWTREEQLRTLMSVDDMVARLRDLIEDEGQTERTWGIFTSDNGHFWGEHRLGGKLYGYEESIRVPFRMMVPGAPATKIPALVANHDIAPTLLELAGDASVREMDGRSLLPLIGKETDRIHGSIYLEAYSGDRYPEWFRYEGLRTKRWKYIRWVSGAEELYDLKNDRFELRNVAEQRPKKVENLRTRMERKRSS